MDNGGIPWCYTDMETEEWGKCGINCQGCRNYSYDYYNTFLQLDVRLSLEFLVCSPSMILENCTMSVRNMNMNMNMDMNMNMNMDMNMDMHMKMTLPCGVQHQGIKKMVGIFVQRDVRYNCAHPEHL